MVKNIRQKKLFWLGVNLWMVFSMVLIGGITRLTDSGLSITNWNLIHGIIPPLNQTDWINLFSLYKQYPEYNIKNPTMTLIEFKEIFFWEYLHRIWGRLIGITFFIPLIYIWVKGGFIKNEKKLILLLSTLGFFQAFMGWYMVKSGLIDRPDVSHFRLSAHLLIAFLIYSLLLYFFCKVFSEHKVRYMNEVSNLITHRKNFFASLFLLLSTISAGALVSGTDAGLAYNTFPYMGDSLLPPILVDEGKVYLEKLLNDQGFLQFVHRVLATFTVLFILHTIFKASKDGLFDNFKIMFKLLLSAILLQYILGIVILKLYVPIYLGLMHQLGGLILLTLIIISISEIQRGIEGARITRSAKT